MEVALEPETIKLIPGAFRASKCGVVMTTVLGSCVSACLYDSVGKVAGMNHFLLSNRRYSKSMHFTRTEAGRYGVQSMEVLINEMLKLGAKRDRIEAKAFGGGRVLNIGKKDNFLCVGAVNVDFIRAFLEMEEIPLISSALGGTVGRTIRFDTSDFSVYVKDITPTQRTKIDKIEMKHRLKSIGSHVAVKPDIELW